MKDRIVYYKDANGKWRWKVVAAENGLTIGASSESYENYTDCVANMKRLGSISTREFSAEVVDG